MHNNFLHSIFLFFVWIFTLNAFATLRKIREKLALTAEANGSHRYFEPQTSNSNKNIIMQSNYFTLFGKWKKNILCCLMHNYKHVKHNKLINIANTGKYSNSWMVFCRYLTDFSQLLIDISVNLIAFGQGWLYDRINSYLIQVLLVIFRLINYIDVSNDFYLLLSLVYPNLLDMLWWVSI